MIARRRRRWLCGCCERAERRRKVRAILHWPRDPVGAGVPEAEYDRYVCQVLVLLMRRAERSEVADCLRGSADEEMTTPLPEDRGGVWSTC